MKNIDESTIQEYEKRIYPEYYGSHFFMTPESVLRRYLEERKKKQMPLDIHTKEHFHNWYHKNIFVSFQDEEFAEAFEVLIAFYHYYQEEEMVYLFKTLRELLK